MTIRRLFPVFLVLLQSGLVAGHAHAHPDLARHTQTPHLHTHELFDLFAPEHSEHEHDGDEHDADAVDLSNMMASAAPPALDLVALDLAPIDAGPVFGASPDLLLFPLGLPPSTAGPQTPLYITLCSFRN